MANIRIIGVILALILMAYLILYRRKIPRSDMILGSTISLVILALSLDPAIASPLQQLLSFRNRLFALLTTSVLFLLFMVIYLTRSLHQTQDQVAHLVQMIGISEFKRNKHIPPQSIVTVIPAYREADNIVSVLKKLPQDLSGHPVIPLVVIDGNYDTSEKLISDLNQISVMHVINLGQGAALQTGFKLAHQCDALVVITMDADGQHRSEDLLMLIDPILANKADFVMGSRFMGQYADEGGARHFGIVIFSSLFSFLSGTRITDVTNGYRAIRGSKINLLHLVERRFSAPEILLQAIYHHLRIREVPVVIEKRASGESKKPKRLGYPLRFGWAMLKAWMRLA